MYHKYSSRKRRGLTLMELLVLMALLLFLLGFLLAAAARVRNTADRTISQNNLRRIVLGTIELADQHQGKLPPGPANGFPGNGLVANNGHGPCLFHLLPYVEQDPLYKSTRKDINGKAIYASREADGKSVKLFLSPNDPTYEKGSA